jgi:hypothetical protein
MGKRVRPEVCRKNENFRTLLFFSEKTGVHSCTVRDITNLGAGIRIEQDLKIVPLDFALSFDNFRTVRMCRLIWRQATFSEWPSKADRPVVRAPLNLDRLA